MEFEYIKGRIKLNKTLNVIDRFVLDFIRILDELKIKYVIISGYVVLLFGRPRLTEDVDMFVEQMDNEKLESLFEALQKEYWIINASSLVTLKLLFSDNSAFRVARKNEISPNMEVKRPKDALGFLSFNSPIEVLVNDKYKINISPLEIQVAYKLYLGSKKDLEDARYIFDIFKKNLDKNTIRRYAKELKVYDKLYYLGDSFA